MQKRTASLNKTKQPCDNLLKTYFNQIKDYPLLTFEDELELSKQIQKGNSDALHRLVNSNLRLVIKIAGVFSVPDIPILDIIQEGNLGLIHAAEKFDYRRNVRFCTYASWWIRQYINRYISNKRRIVRLPLRKEEALKKIQRTYNVLCQTLMHQPANTDIAKELGLSVQDVDAIVNLTAGSVSFDQNIKEDDGAGAVDIHEDYTYSPERNFMKQFSHDGTLNILNKLKDREKHILNYRYQLNGCEHHTLREIGDKFDISPETVRQIEIKALRKIRSHANELREYVYVEAI
jgi:RNA polymerase primary sigma factor